MWQGILLSLSLNVIWTFLPPSEFAVYKKIINKIMREPITSGVKESSQKDCLFI